MKLKLSLKSLKFAVFLFPILLLLSFFSVVYATSTPDSSPSEPTFVTIYQKSKKLTVKTGPTTVKALLERLRIKTSPHDQIEPALDTKITSSQFHINIYSARPVAILDSGIYKVFISAKTDPASLASDANIPFYDGDRLELTNSDQFLEFGIIPTYRLYRSGGKIITTTTEIPYLEEVKKDYTITPGTKKELRVGEIGRKVQKYRVFTRNNQPEKQELIEEDIIPPVNRLVALGAHPIEMKPLTPSQGRNRYTINGIERQETFYDLNMKIVMRNCQAGGKYSVRQDGVKIDPDGLVIVAAELSRYPRCSIVQTSLGLGKVYDTGSFALTNPEQFDIATDWTRRDGI